MMMPSCGQSLKWGKIFPPKQTKYSSVGGNVYFCPNRLLWVEHLFCLPAIFCCSQPHKIDHESSHEIVREYCTRQHFILCKISEIQSNLNPIQSNPLNPIYLETHGRFTQGDQGQARRIRVRHGTRGLQTRFQL